MTTWSEVTDRQTAWIGESGYIKNLIVGTPIGLLLSLTYPQDRKSWGWEGQSNIENGWSGTVIHTDWSDISQDQTIWS